MRILYHHRTQAEDGQAVHIRALQRAFEQEGHEVHEVSLVARRPDAPAPAPETVPADGAGRDGREPEKGAGSRWGWVTRMPRFARELAEYAYGGLARSRIVGAGARFDPDFLYERYAFGNVAGVLAARRLGVPLVLEVNSPMVLELGRTRGLSFPDMAARVERFVFQNADLVCVVTGVLRDMLVDMGVDPARLLVTPNGVHPELYAEPGSAVARRSARASLGLPEEPGDELVLGFVGYYRDWHRLDLVVDALADPALARARLVLVGTGPAHEGLAARAAERGVAERVLFAGPRPHDAIPGLLPAFDVALVPAINPYASPLKLHEYMAAGLAVVGPDQPNIREVLTDGENALLVPAGDGEALRGALVRLAGDAALRARLGAAALDTVRARDLTWRGNARRVVGAVESLLARRREGAA